MIKTHPPNANDMLISLLFLMMNLLQGFSAPGIPFLRLLAPYVHSEVQRVIGIRGLSPVSRQCTVVAPSNLLSGVPKGVNEGNRR